MAHPPRRVTKYLSQINDYVSLVSTRLHDLGEMVGHFTGTHCVHSSHVVFVRFTLAAVGWSESERCESECPPHGISECVCVLCRQPVMQSKLSSTTDKLVEYLTLLQKPASSNSHTSWVDSCPLFSDQVSLSLEIERSSSVLWPGVLSLSHSHSHIHSHI